MMRHGRRVLAVIAVAGVVVAGGVAMGRTGRETRASGDTRAHPVGSALQFRSTRVSQGGPIPSGAHLMFTAELAKVGQDIQLLDAVPASAPRGFKKPEARISFLSAASSDYSHPGYPGLSCLVGAPTGLGATAALPAQLRRGDSIALNFLAQVPDGGGTGEFVGIIVKYAAGGRTYVQRSTSSATGVDENLPNGQCHASEWFLPDKSEVEKLLRSRR